MSVRLTRRGVPKHVEASQETNRSVLSKYGSLYQRSFRLLCYRFSATWKKFGSPSFRTLTLIPTYKRPPFRLGSRIFNICDTYSSSLTSCAQLSCPQTSLNTFTNSNLQSPLDTLYIFFVHIDTFIFHYLIRDRLPS